MDRHTVVVTGGAGFIGSAVVRLLLAESDSRVVNIDKLTYAAHDRHAANIADPERYVFHRLDLQEKSKLSAVFAQHKPRVVLHLAAETHVDRSITNPRPFIESNILGTYSLLEVVREYLSQMDEARRSDFRFQHISTDEVFGSLGPHGTFTEVSRYEPSSPYAATKAASDHIVRSWARTFGVPAVVTNCSNNFGPFQFPEKLIPVTILNAKKGKALPVYGNGQNVRDWIYVDDHARALLTVMKSARVNETYVIGAGSERSNIEVIRAVCTILDRLLPDSPWIPHEQLIQFVADRAGHDFRYALDASKIRDELGWKPQETFESGLEKTVRWYLSDAIRMGEKSDCRNQAP